VEASRRNSTNFSITATDTDSTSTLTHILAYEAITAALLTSSSAKSRVRELLEALVDLTSEKPSSKLLLADQALTTATTAVLRIVLEP
jgi:hypothetical protein